MKDDNRAEVDYDEIINALSNEESRRTIYYLSSLGPDELEGGKSLDEVAQELSGTPSETGELKMRLHHIDLPKLDNLDAISYNSETRVIESYSPSPVLETLAEDMRELEEG